jgi:hypothetical protein
MLGTGVGTCMWFLKVIVQMIADIGRGGADEDAREMLYVL